MVKGPLTSISLAILAVVASSAPTSPFNARDTSSSNGTSSNNGLTDKVSWDEYSIYVDNEPLTLLSGEFHVCTYIQVYMSERTYLTHL